MLRVRFFEIALVLVRLGQLSAAYCSKSRTASESGSVALLKKEKPTKLDRSQFTDEELAFIDLYHRICLPIGLGFCR